MKVFRYIRTVVGFQQEFGAVLDVPAVVLQSSLNALQTNAVPYVALFPSPLILEALQHRSKQLTQSAVSAMLKEASCVSAGDRIERLTHCLN
jgi:hypothetical protein